MKKLLALAFMLSGFLFIVSCGDDEKDPVDLAEPTVTAPSATSVQVGTTVELTFTFAAEAGFTSSDVSSTGGTATITTDGTAGATTGSIVVSFVAGSASGAGSVTVEVTDAEGDSEDAVVILTVVDSPVPSISGIPATASVAYGATLEVSDVELTAEDGFASFEVSVDGGTALDLTSLITVGETSATIDISFPTVELEAGNHALVFTLEDEDGDVATASHVLTIEEEITEIIVSTNISSNTTWSTGKTYVLAGRITVLSGATLTIEAGTVVKGEAGTGSNATALLIARGGKLMAEGTQELPIIFTSVADELTPEDVAAGNYVSPNLDPTINGLWGGVIVLGSAQISASNTSGQLSEVQIEGIPTSDSNGLYGGTANDDNSGVIKYISIRHGGSNIGNGNEINGLTLGGVGSGTVIEGVEIVSNQDDGIEWFGGAVSVTNASVWNIGDDGIDTDQAWSGTLDNFVVIAPNTAGAHLFELDGPEGTYLNGHIIKNGSCIASTGTSGTTSYRLAENLIDVDANSDVDLENIYITGIVAGQDINRTTAALVTFTGIQLNIPAGTSLQAYVTGTIPAGVTAVTTRTVGATLSELEWTWAFQADMYATIE